MIPGAFYQGASIDLVLQTDVTLTGATVSIMAKAPDGEVIELDGEITDFTSITATLSAEKNDQAGQWLLQAKAEFDDGEPVFGETLPLFIQIPFAESP